MSAKITVRRDPTIWRDRLRSYKLVVDGRTIASVRSGEEKTVSVESGEHRVWMKISWCRSPILNVNLASGQRAKMACEPGGALPFALLYITVLRDRYINLRLDSIV